MLQDELNKEDPVNLDEPSNSPTPFTPLFIAYINDHYQVLIKKNLFDFIIIILPCFVHRSW